MDQERIMQTNNQPFSISIDPGVDGYIVSVVESPMGQARTRLQSFSIPSNGFGLRSYPSLVDGELQSIGVGLFSTLFNDDVATCYRTSLAITRREKQRLQLNLRFNQAPHFAILPWELMYDLEETQFLALTTNISINRYVELPQAQGSLAVVPPLRILCVFPSPSDYPELEVDKEWRLLQQMLVSEDVSGSIRLERLSRPTLADLHSRLIRGDIHVLHIVGHGTSPTAIAEEGQLAFEDTTGRSDLVSASQLAITLQNHASLRLVFLSTCDGAVATEDSLFAGIAQTLIRRGLPSAIAMQMPITDEGARELDRVFYTALANGLSIEASLTHARAFLSASGSKEWMAPVLFLRSLESVIVDPQLAVESRGTDEPTYLVDDINLVTPLPLLDRYVMQHVLINRRSVYDSLLTHIRNKHQITTIIGLAGIGKSTLARVVVEYLLSENWSIFWLDCAQYPHLSQDLLLELLSTFLRAPSILNYRSEGRQPNPGNNRTLVDILRTRHKTLIVFDNLEQMLDDNSNCFLDEGIESVFDNLTSAQHNACLLVVSRVLPDRQRGRVQLSDLTKPTVELEGLSFEFGVALMTELYGLPNTSALSTIVENVGGHPYALQLLAPEIELMGAQEVLSDALLWHESIEGFAVWLFARLSLEQRQFLARLSVFRKSQSVSSIWATGGSDKTSTRELLRTLRGRGLIQASMLGAEVRYSLPPLVKGLAFGFLTEEQLSDAHLNAYRIYDQQQLPAQADWDHVEDIAPLLEAIYHACEARNVHLALKLFLTYELVDILDRWGLHNQLIGLGKQLLGDLTQSVVIPEFLRPLGFNEFGPAAHDTLANSCRQIGKMLRMMGMHPVALSFLEFGIELLADSTNRIRRAGLLHEAALVSSWLSNSVLALEYSKQGIQLVESLSYRSGRLVHADLLMSQGHVLFGMRHFEDTASSFEDAHRIYKSLDLLSRAYRAFDNTGLVLQMLGDAKESKEDANNCYQQAIEHHMEASIYFRNSSDYLGEAGATENLGAVHYRRAELSTAEHMYRQALYLYETVGYSRGLMSCRYDLGEVLLDQDHYEDAKAYLKAALSNSEELEDMDFRVDILYKLITTHLRVGDLSEARRLLPDLTSAITLAAREDDMIQKVHEIESAFALH